MQFLLLLADFALKVSHTLDFSIARKLFKIYYKSDIYYFFIYNSNYKFFNADKISLQK